MAMDQTAVCVVDDQGAVHLGDSGDDRPEPLFAVLKPFLARLRRVGHEAGSLLPWLYPELKKPGLPGIRTETHHVRAALSAQRNKTDKADTLVIATSCAPAGAGRSISGRKAATEPAFC